MFFRSSTGLEPEQLLLLPCACVHGQLCSWSLFLLNISYTFKQLDLYPFGLISGFAFWGQFLLFSFISFTNETWGVGRATLFAGIVLQQSDSCPADTQGKLNGHSQVLSGKMQESGNHPLGLR